MAEQQKQVFEDIKNGTAGTLEKPTEGTFLIPKWQTVAKTYPEALQKMLNAISASRPFYNYRSDSMDRFKESEGKIAAMKKLKTDGDYYVLDAQLGNKWKGKSVKEVRESYMEGEFGLGAFEVACILVQYPGILQSYTDLWIDCPGDEYAGGGFSGAPDFRFHDGQVGFGTDGVSCAGGLCGSASGILPQ